MYYCSHILQGYFKPHPSPSCIIVIRVNVDHLNCNGAHDQTNFAESLPKTGWKPNFRKNCLICPSKGDSRSIGQTHLFSENERPAKFVIQFVSVTSKKEWQYFCIKKLSSVLSGQSITLKPSKSPCHLRSNLDFKLPQLVRSWWWSEGPVAPVASGIRGSEFHWTPVTSNLIDRIYEMSNQSPVFTGLRYMPNVLLLCRLETLITGFESGLLRRPSSAWAIW